MQDLQFCSFYWMTFSLLLQLAKTEFEFFFQLVKLDYVCLLLGVCGIFKYH